jgi:hypothetical protein
MHIYYPHGAEITEQSKKYYDFIFTDIEDTYIFMYINIILKYIYT